MSLTQSGEVLSLQIGQAGVQLGSACWELFCLEHGVTPDGASVVSGQEQGDHTVEVLFREGSTGRLVPRAVFLDLEPTVLDEVRTGTYKDLFHAANLVSGKEDAANNYARGHYTIGREIVDVVVERVRQEVEQCERLQGLLLHHSYGGGTGSGFTSLLLEVLTTLYPKTPAILLSILPSPRISTSMVEPYNSVLCTNATLEYSDVSFPLDNEALYNVCSKMLAVARPTYTNLNRLTAQVLSTVTASLRYEGGLCADLSSFQTNLVPYPRLHFPIISYSPIISRQNMPHERLTTQLITQHCFDLESQLTCCNPYRARYMSCCLAYQGCVSPTDVNRALATVKRQRSIHFVDWCPTGFKVSINYQLPMKLPGGDMGVGNKAAAMMANTTAITQVWRNLATKFDHMYRKRAFVFWFVGEGLEEGELQEAREELELLINDYEEAARATVDDEIT